MLIIMSDQYKVVLRDLLAKETTINEAYYTSLLQNLRDRIEAKTRCMLNKLFCLIRYNAPVNDANVVQMKAHFSRDEIFLHLTLLISHHLTKTSFQSHRLFEGEALFR